MPGNNCDLAMIGFVGREMQLGCHTVLQVWQENCPLETRVQESLFFLYYVKRLLHYFSRLVVAPLCRMRVIATLFAGFKWSQKSCSTSHHCHLLECPTVNAVIALVESLGRVWEDRKGKMVELII